MRRVGLIDQAAARFRDEIVSGRWAVGERIPTEAALVAEFGVGRNTVREAVRALEHAGILEPRRGDGTYVRAADGLDAATITGRALAGGCDRCAATVDMFCAMLGTVAADLALTLGARGGVYIGGGVVPRLGERFAASPFRARFEEKGRFGDYLAGIPVFVIHADYPALRGAARALDD